MEFLWSAVLTVAVMLLGWVFTMMQNRMNEIDHRHSRAMESTVESITRAAEAQVSAHSRMQDIVTNIQINYVHKDDLKELRKEFLDRFDRLETLIKRDK